MSLFVLASKDGWVNIMYHGLDAVGVDQQVSTYNCTTTNVIITFTDIIEKEDIIQDLSIMHCNRKTAYAYITVECPNYQKLTVSLGIIHI